MSLAPRTPDLKANLAINNGTFGTLLSTASIGSLIMLLIGGQIVHVIGAKLALRIGMSIIALAFITLCHTHSPVVFLIANITAGVGISTYHIGSSGHTLHRQDEVGKNIISRLHGAWGVGAVTTALLGFILSDHVSIAWHITVLMIIVWLFTQYTVTKLSPTFPPKTADGTQKLRETRAKLAKFNPEFFSVTFGAGGSTRDRTMDTVLEIQQEGFNAAPHISCISSSKEEIRELLQAYQSKGINRLVALRGDIPSGEVSAGDFRYAAELVEFIRAETGNHFHIEVAAYPEFHPEAKTPAADLLNLKRKMDAGANSAITQYFYNADAYFRFVDQCRASGISMPIIPGVMPIYNITQLARFSSVCGAEIPRWLKMRLEEYGDDMTSLRAFGVDVVSELCESLQMSGVPSLHFYTLNQAGVIGTILENIGH